MNSSEASRIVTAADPNGLAEEAARTFVSRAQGAISTQGMFRVALSGGQTPALLYERLASPPYRDQVDWGSVQVFFSDERFVPPDSPESNYRLAHETLLSKVPIPERFVHRVPTVDILPQEAAALYAEGIRRVFAVGQAEIPSFDFILLGLGSDGHTASLFPDSEALTATELVVANFLPRLDSWRLTFSYPLLNGAACVAFLVQGAEKAPIVARVLTEDALPASRVRPTNGELVWLLDEAAAANVPKGQGR